MAETTASWKGHIKKDLGSLDQSKFEGFATVFTSIFKS